jgi:hypothetical protein
LPGAVLLLSGGGNDILSNARLELGKKTWARFRCLQELDVFHSAHLKSVSRINACRPNTSLPQEEASELQEKLLPLMQRYKNQQLHVWDTRQLADIVDHELISGFSSPDYYRTRIVPLGYNQRPLFSSLEHADLALETSIRALGTSVSQIVERAAMQDVVDREEHSALGLMTTTEPLKIGIHTYDFVYPAPRPAQFFDVFWHDWVTIGQYGWLYPVLRANGLTDPVYLRLAAIYLLRLYRAELFYQQSEFQNNKNYTGVRWIIVDTQGTTDSKRSDPKITHEPQKIIDPYLSKLHYGNNPFVPSQPLWLNELHLSSLGYRFIAERVYKCIYQIPADHKFCAAPVF